MSSKLPEPGRASVHWGNFGAGSVGWLISKEKLLKNVTSISGLKLRASYGSLGNQYLSGAPGGSYLYPVALNTSANYVLGTSQTIQHGAIQTPLASNVRWKERRSQNYGFDLVLLKNRLSLSAGCYISRTARVLLAPNLPTTTSNARALPYQPLGLLENGALRSKWAMPPTVSPSNMAYRPI